MRRLLRAWQARYGRRTPKGYPGSFDGPWPEAAGRELGRLAAGGLLRKRSAPLASWGEITPESLIPDVTGAGGAYCRVYWGSHGCSFQRGHAGPHQCNACWDPDDTEGYVGAWPYYGPETNFYGEEWRG